jgi:hypothetical protein
MTAHNGNDDGARSTTEASDRTGTDVPRVDEPPYQIDPPEEQPDPDEYTEQYLCEELPAEPSVPFDQVQGVQLTDGGLDYTEADPAYRVRSITTQSGLESVVNMDLSPGLDRLDAVDFDTESVIIVESGFGSSSVTQQFKRADFEHHTLHLHGCYTQPFVRTSDYASWATAVIVDHDTRIQLVAVSLTVSAERRVHFDSTEGIVTTDD